MIKSMTKGKRERRDIQSKSNGLFSTEKSCHTPQNEGRGISRRDADELRNKKI